MANCEALFPLCSVVERGKYQFEICFFMNIFSLNFTVLVKVHDK